MKSSFAAKQTCFTLNSPSATPAIETTVQTLFTDSLTFTESLQTITHIQVHGQSLSYQNDFESWERNYWIRQRKTYSKHNTTSQNNVKLQTQTLQQCQTKTSRADKSCFRLQTTLGWTTQNDSVYNTCRELVMKADMRVKGLLIVHSRWIWLLEIVDLSLTE